MIQLIACDLDGTLLNLNKDVTPRTVQAIKAFIDKGGEFVIATGRPYLFAKYIGDLIDSRIRIIAFNGSLVKISDYDCEWYPLEITFSGLEALLNDFKGEGYFKSYNQIYSWHAKTNYFTYPQSIIKTSKIESFNFDDQIIKMLFYCNIEGEVQRLKRDIQKFGPFTMTEYGNVGFELIHSVRNKGVALIDVMNKLKIDASRVAAIGDSQNDLDLFDVAQTKVAVSNAKSELLHLANKIIGHHDNEGVAIYLEELMKERG